MAVTRDRTPGLKVHGNFRGYERRVGEKLWRPVFEADNVVLNQWYIDLFGQIDAAPADRPGGVDPEFSLMALGYGVNPTTSTPANLPPLRTDTQLVFEWSNTVAKLTTARTNAGGPYTTLPCTPLPLAIASGATIVLNGQTLTLTATAALGATSITVASFTPVLGHDDPIGTGIVYTDITIHVPQRLSLVVGVISPSDPPSVTLSYFLPAASNSTPITFTEAGLLYTSGIAQFGTHVGFAYTKGGNTDLRVDYFLARESDE
jgi:hypothetical protein